MRKRIRIILWIVTLALGATALLFVRLRPETIFYAGYNGLSQYSRMYYVDAVSISIDTLLHHELSPKKMRPQKFKNVDTKDFKIRIPLILLFDKRDRIGSPDMIDQGGIIVEYKMFGITKRFDMDPMMDQNVEMRYYTEILSDIDDKMLRIEQELGK